MPSPTFTLVEVYENGAWHLLAFRPHRLERRSRSSSWAEEALAEGIVLVEWPERLGDLLPKHLSVILETDGDGRRALLDV